MATVGFLSGSMYSVVTFFDDVLVLLQLVLVALELRLLREHLDLQRRVELRQHVAGLVRQAELLVGRQVPALVLLGPM